MSEQTYGTPVQLAMDRAWRVIESRDRSLQVALGRVLNDLTEKEKEIGLLKQAVADQDQEIQRLLQIAAERLELIQRQHAELEGLRTSTAYRLGYGLLNPKKLMSRLLRKS